MPVKRFAFAIILGLAGFAINYLPVEIFPGVHLVFGSVMSILAAVKFGPAAGAVAGLTGGLRLWRLWNQPFPLSALIFLLEGLWVGHQTSKKKRSPLIAVLSFWLVAGIWLELIAQLLIIGTSFHLTLIMLARSLINGLLSGIILEIGILVYEIIRTQRAKAEGYTARLDLKSIVTVQLMALISIPLLYISTDNVNDLRGRILGQLASTSSREIKPLESEINSILLGYEYDIERETSILNPTDFASFDTATLSPRLARLRQRRPGLSRICIGDSQGRMRVCDPPLSQSEIAQGQPAQQIQHYYNELMTARSIVHSSVLQEQGKDSRLAVAIGAPVSDEQGRFAGFIIGWFDLREFQQAVDKYESSDEILVIADARGNLVADSSLMEVNPQNVISLSGRWDYELVRGQNQSSFYYTRPGAGEPPLSLKHTHMLSTVPIAETGWIVWSVKSLDSFTRTLEDAYLDNVIVLLLALFSTLAFSYFMAGWLTSPVGELQESAAELAAGNWIRPKRTRFLTADFDSLFRSFRAMAERLEMNWNHQQHLLGEASLARGELEATFDAMADAVAIIDIDDHLLRANRAFYEMHDLSMEDSIGRPYTELVHRDSDWQSCEACVARRAGRQVFVTTRWNKGDGEKSFEVRVDPLFNAERQRIGAVQVLRDMTEIRAAEAEAEEAGSLLRNLVDSAFDVVYATDLEGRFLWANKRASDIYGAEADSLAGESFLHLVHKDDEKSARNAFEIAVKGEAQVYECRFQIPDKEVHYALVTHSPIYSEERVTAVLSIVRDITKERMAAEQSMLNDKLRALGQLASGIAHNFNNSLTAILGYTQMVMGKASDPVILQYLRTVEMAALDSARMVQRIQSFARQRQGEALITANLNHIVRDALDLTRSRWRDDARAASITYDIIFRPEEGVTVKCDPSALREVFVNIIINAIDAMPEGGRLTISTVVEGAEAVISFADTGLGIPKDLQQRIFDPFFTTKGPEGHGLGLAVAYGIVRRHGGEIFVESEPDKGTTFIFKFPLSVLADSERPVFKPAEIANQAYVLVVDDEAPIRLLLSNLVRTLGHKVLMAENGLVALKALEGATFDLVITDLSMPHLDGWSLVKEVRDRWPETKVMIVTGYGDMADTIAPTGDRRMADAFMSKPFDLSEVGDKINELLVESGHSQ